MLYVFHAFFLSTVLLPRLCSHLFEALRASPACCPSACPVISRPVVFTAAFPVVGPISYPTFCANNVDTPDPPLLSPPPSGRRVTVPLLLLASSVLPCPALTHVVSSLLCVAHCACHASFLSNLFLLFFGRRLTCVLLFAVALSVALRFPHIPCSFSLQPPCVPAIAPSRSCRFRSCVTTAFDRICSQLRSHTLHRFTFSVFTPYSAPSITASVPSIPPSTPTARSNAFFVGWPCACSPGYFLVLYLRLSPYLFPFSLFRLTL